MIITLIGICFILSGIVVLIIYNKKNCISLLNLYGIIAIVIGGIITITCIICIIGGESTADKQIYDNANQRESIVKQLECIDSDYEDVSKAMIIAKVYNWNKAVYDAKYWASNPWFNWFWNKRVVDSLEYIDID